MKPDVQCLHCVVVFRIQSDNTASSDGFWEGLAPSLSTACTCSHGAGALDGLLAICFRPRLQGLHLPLPLTPQTGSAQEAVGGFGAECSLCVPHWSGPDYAQAATPRKCRWHRITLSRNWTLKELKWRSQGCQQPPWRPEGAQNAGEAALGVSHGPLWKEEEDEGGRKPEDQEMRRPAPGQHRTAHLGSPVLTLRSEPPSCAWVSDLLSCSLASGLGPLTLLSGVMLLDLVAEGRKGQ